jgi:Uma2 family endonuclease
MILIEEARATLDDLYREPGKAELIGGRIVRLMSVGLGHGMVGGNIYAALRAFAKQSKRGVALGDNVGYIVPELPSGRESFSADASFFENPDKQNLDDFIHGAPVFAVEIQSKNDYGPAAECDMAVKRADYFAAGTKVVWDVDSKAECIHAYSKAAPSIKRTFTRGQIADAEPALPGFRMSVEEVFEK